MYKEFVSGEGWVLYVKEGECDVCFWCGRPLDPPFYFEENKLRAFCSDCVLNKSIQRLYVNARNPNHVMIRIIKKEVKK